MGCLKELSLELRALVRGQRVFEVLLGQLGLHTLAEVCVAFVRQKAQLRLLALRAFQPPEQVESQSVTVFLNDSLSLP